jgi:hypothetical protein
MLYPAAAAFVIIAAGTMNDRRITVMSIYSTLWCLKFPRAGLYHPGCEWIEVFAQGVPADVGSSYPGSGYEDGDPYAAFLPPAIADPPKDDLWAMRAVVFVTAGTPKGTARSGQEYVAPLLVLTGQEYAALPFQTLHDRICELLARGQPRCVSMKLLPDGKARLTFDDGSSREVGVE